jgi:class 3 adenylate cyclase
LITICVVIVLFVISHCKQLNDDAFSLLPKKPEVETMRDAALVVADVSGFTKLNESFSALGHRGAEQVTDHLNRYFSHLLHIVEQVSHSIFIQSSQYANRV